MNRRGQALVEFVLILPVLIFILFAIIDCGIIFSSKSNLENDSSDIIELFKNDKEIEEIKKLYLDTEISISEENGYYIFNISTSISLITPGLNKILGDPYVLNVERVVPNEFE